MPPSPPRVADRLTQVARVARCDCGFRVQTFPWEVAARLVTFEPKFSVLPYLGEECHLLLGVTFKFTAGVTGQH